MLYEPNINNWPQHSDITQQVYSDCGKWLTFVWAYSTACVFVKDLTA